MPVKAVRLRQRLNYGFRHSRSNERITDIQHHNRKLVAT